MWTCGKCNEQVEPDFEVCWNCGTSRDGILDPEFKAVSEYQPGDLAPPEALTNEQLLTERFVCPRCRRRGAAVRRMRMNPTELLAIFRWDLLAASCTGCGYTELYNPDAIEGRPFHEALDELFNAGR